MAILVCGKLDAFKDALKIYKETPEAVQQRMVPMIHEFYEGKKQLQRDEAIRGASLAAMSLMYGAKNRGWATGPGPAQQPAPPPSVAADQPRESEPAQQPVPSQGNETDESFRAAPPLPSCPRCGAGRVLPARSARGCRPGGRADRARLPG